MDSAQPISPSLTLSRFAGTHDSGTYCFDKEKGASPDSDLTTTIQDKMPGRLLRAVSDVILSQVFGRLCQCQDKNFEEQLNSGVRYLDLRVAFHEESGGFFTCHGVYCADMTDVMKQIKDFMDANPKVRYSTQLQLQKWSLSSLSSSLRSLVTCRKL